MKWLALLVTTVLVGAVSGVVYEVASSPDRTQLQAAGFGLLVAFAIGQIGSIYLLVDWTKAEPFLGHRTADEEELMLTREIRDDGWQSTFDI